MKSAQAVAVAILATGIQLVSALEPTFYHCYNTNGTMTEHQIAIKGFNSRGACRQACVDAIVSANKGTGYSVMGLSNGACVCGNYFPNKAYKVNNSFCKFPCPGYKDENCGSRLQEYVSVYTTGLDAQPDEDPAKSSSQSSSSTSSTSTTSSSTSSTVEPSATDETSTKPNPVNKAAVAAGCVVSVLIIVAIGVGAWIFLRRRRRQRVEEEFRRSAAVREFAQKPASDHRLDPGMVQRRDSVGSIADNQDYSRRILKVTNPDG